MGRAKRWVIGPIVDGVGSYNLSSWKYFHDFVYQEMLDFTGYVWRGQRCDNWKLESTFDRAHRMAAVKIGLKKHLQTFQLAARGRRGLNPPLLLNDNDWWALGQHNGLATPLLDWSGSPFTAAYFAYIDRGQPQTSSRAIYALSQPTIEKKSTGIQAAHTGIGRAPKIDFVVPMSDENARLVNQGGLFTRAPFATDIEAWVKNNFPGDDSYVLIKITVPNADRSLALRSLNRMNINHLTLFPDLYGASKFANMLMDIKNY